MIDNIRTISVLLAVLMAVSACAPLTPEITEKERQELSRTTPFSNEFGSMQALSKLREMIVDKAKIPPGIVIQPKPITNTSVSTLGQGKDIPFDVTNIVITALSRLSSQKVKIVPYDPNFVITSSQITNSVASSHLQPNLILGGSITEFDKDIEVKKSDLRFDALLDQGSPNTEAYGDADNSIKMSRITLDLYLLNAVTQEVLPGTSISNTIRVVEIEKGRGFNFEIFGSGLEIGGRIRSTQGFHRAVRNLIGYSVVQLFGRAFELNYEPLLGISTNDPFLERKSQNAQPSAPSYISPPPRVSKPSVSSNQEKQKTTASKHKQSVPTSSAINLQIALVHQQSTQIENSIVAGGVLNSGAQYRIIVKPEQNCYLYVFQKDSANKLYTVFPVANLQQKQNNPLESGVAYFFPGKETVFVLDKNRGREQVYFYATAKPDRRLNKLLRQHNQAVNSIRKEDVERQIMTYLATKDIVDPVRPDLTLYDGNNSVQMTKIQRLCRNNMYVLSFMHR